ncbi:hybrid sensor histidine kinase/response regulator transcription factor [Anaerophaga thermohalophila]|uniref:hybrid sensor histidine kinase/response regulator transcription factor n=1 Tax=Anaerophaga thermohalophila TaxID=177400 RepID=UPI000237CFAE|nr:two-component regulator propeller domain-containing protein [Anaerophaga thermohalophila]
MRRSRVFLCFWLFGAVLSFSQKNYHWTHYTSNDGLSQNAVMSILQDRRGFMWFATWDGLSRFDGYRFSNYKIRPGDDVEITSSRIDYIVEDKYGFIWLLAYGKDVCRFDPLNEKFVNVPEEKELEIAVETIVTLPGGTTWLLSDSQGGIRVVTDSVSYTLTSQLFSLASGNIASNTINSVFEDRNGNEWLLTGNGLCFISAEDHSDTRLFFNQKGLNGTTKQSFFVARDFGNEIWFGAEKGHIWKYDKSNQKFSLLKLPSAGNIIALYLLRQKECLIATGDDGFFIYDKNNGKAYVHYSVASKTKLKSNVILYTWKDSYGDVWLQQDIDSIARFNEAEGEIVYYNIKGHSFQDIDCPKFMIHEDINQILWIHPLGGGVSYFDRKNNRLVPFLGKGEDPMSLSDRLHSMNSDRQGNLWMSTRAKGLDKFVFPHSNFNLLTPEKFPKTINDNQVRAVAEDHRGRIWIATKSDVISVYDEGHNFLGRLGPDGKLHENACFSDATAYSIVAGKHGIMWIGTKGEGLIKAVPCGGEDDFCYMFYHFKSSEDDLYSLSHNSVYHIFEDMNGRLWIATYGGGINMVEDPYRSDNNLKFINYRNHFNKYPFESCYRVRFITSGPDKKIWAATTNGLVVFDGEFENVENISFRHYVYTAGDSACLSNNDVHDILLASDGVMYFATFGGGLNRLVSFSKDSVPRFEHYTVDQGLPSDVLFALLEDSKGNIWMSTENGLSRYNPRDQSFLNYHQTDYAYDLRFSESSHIKDSKGNLWFGNHLGALWFHPDMLSKSSFVPPLSFTGFRLFNREVVPGEQSVLKKPVDAVDEIVLKHNQNIFSIGFAALDMKYPASVKYAVKLEGFDGEWRCIDGQRMATYTNIPHGEYIFKVRSTNSDGVWVNNERRLPLTVLPSFWVTPLAYMIYIVMFLGIVTFGGYVLMTIFRLRHKAELEHQLAEMKLDFFTNVSHELRTPLTLINGPLEEVLKEKELSDRTKELLHIIKKNSDRMLRLIDQILDFVKIHNDKMKLTVEQIPVVSFVRQVMDHFRFRAMDENIEFTLDNRTQEVYIWADADKFEKIIYNLLSNAFKYIGDGKKVTVGVDDVGDYVEIAVCDDGMGISEGKIDRLFGRFENNPEQKINRYSSSGIGLAVVKEFIDMHNADIQVKSMPGEGTKFRLLFRKGLEHYDKDVQVLKLPSEYISDVRDSRSDELELKGKEENVKGHSSSERVIILLVEDNKEVRNFIKSTLTRDYHVIEAWNGEDGLKKARKKRPDLIISDLMMPVMDGFTFLQNIRADIETSHIPFIILTARSNLENQLLGLEKGADAYISKPFSPSYLKACINNLLERQRQLQQLFSERVLEKAGHIEIEPSQPEITSMDEAFIRKLISFMEKNMDNNDLVVDDLVTEMGVSRSVFFKKMKALTGMAPIEFIRDIRMKRAAQLIKIGDYNINQVAFMVGINDARYFSRCFREKFGMSPSEYKDA